MKREDRKITFGMLKTMRLHRQQLEQKLREVENMLTCLDHPLLPENWTDADAWELAGSLAKLMALVVQASDTGYDAQHPYPSDETLLENVPYYDAFDLPGQTSSYHPDSVKKEIGFWTEVLHCGILVAAAKPKYAFPSEGTFADLKKLFDTLMNGGGPAIRFDHILDILRQTLSEEHSWETLDLCPEPPVFKTPESTQDEYLQVDALDYWMEWNWFKNCPCRGELRKAIERIKSEELHDKVMHFIHWDLHFHLNLVIDLYLYQTGASGMLDDSFYVSYAMLSRTQKKIRTAMEEG